MAQALPLLSGNGGLDLSVGPFVGFIDGHDRGRARAPRLGAPWLLVPIVLGLGPRLRRGQRRAGRLPAAAADHRDARGRTCSTPASAVEILPTPGRRRALVARSRSTATIGPIPGVLFVLAAIAVGWILLSRTAYVRNLLAVGGDIRAAYTAGIDVAATRVLAYALGGMLARHRRAALHRPPAGRPTRTAGDAYTVYSTDGRRAGRDRARRRPRRAARRRDRRGRAVPDPEPADGGGRRSPTSSTSPTACC